MRVRIDSLAWLSKEDLGEVNRRALKDRLRVTPRKTHPKSEPQPIELFDESELAFGVPRQFFFQSAQLKHEVEYAWVEGADISWDGVTFSGELRPSQAEALPIVIGALHREYGGILHAPTGWGKTAFACALISRLKRPTIVIVHTQALMDQWVERFSQFLPMAKIGAVQGNTYDFSGKHVVVSMLQTLISRLDDYEQEFRDYFGLLVADEVHHLSAPVFSKVPRLFRAKYRFGLSATPRRRDGTQCVFEWIIGKVVHSVRVGDLRPRVYRIDTAFRDLNPGTPEDVLLKMMQYNTTRNESIISYLMQAVEAGRRVLLLSKRIRHLKILHRMFELEQMSRITLDPNSRAYQLLPDARMGNELAFAELKEELRKGGIQLVSSGLCIGGVRGEELEEIKRVRVIFATSQYVSEGFDVPELDTLFLTMPSVDIEQAVGRILRLSPNKKQPFVVDFRDDYVPAFKRWGRKRDEFFSKVEVDG